MRAAVYARFSSENQREQSIEDQIRVCKEFAKRDGITVLEEHIYFDEAQSGAIRSRPGLEALKKAAEDKLFEAVLVDDSPRLSRDNQHFNTLLCLFEFWGVSLISVSDGLDMREEHAKVAYQFRGIINELYLTDLKKKTHRGQMGQVLRGFSVGSRGYGYTAVPEGESKYDKKGRLRADGFKLVVVPEEARIIQRVFSDFIGGKAITRIAKELNEERVPTKARLKGGWNVSTLSRILKDEKYIGRFAWNRTTTVKDPLTGKMKQVDRPKDDWVVQERPDIRIVSDEEWTAAQARWREIDGVFPRNPGKRGFEGKRKSYVDSHPGHLLSGALKCGACAGAIALVSGKGSGYYGCLNASRRSCDNKVMIPRKRVEDKFIQALNEMVLDPEILEVVCERTARKIREQFAHVPETLRLKKVELNRAETRVHNFIEFVASGRATPALAEALAQAEEQVTPERPQVGRPYFRVNCKVDSLNLLHVADGGALSLSAPPAARGRGPSWTPSSSLDSVHFGATLLHWWTQQDLNL